MSRSDGNEVRFVALDPSADEIRQMGIEAIEWMAGYLDSVRDLRVYPRTSAAELKSLLEEPLPQEGRDFSDLLDVFREVIAPGSRHNGHPRFFGYVSAPGTAVASVADLLAATLNANLTAWRSAPAPVQLERLAIDWIKQAMGFDPGAGGLFVSGGSMANFAALAAARQRQCGDAVTVNGLQAIDKPLRIYVSQEGHHSIDKAAALLGIGHANVQRVSVDQSFRMDVHDLKRRIGEDRDSGAEPFCIVATAGTVTTGAVDPLAEVAAVAQREGLWMHVDACYGGFARLAPSARPLFSGLQHADSIALDPHKWLYLPANCGCILYRDPATVRPAFALGADYTRVMEQGPDETYAFWDYGPELSRSFRALKVWMVMAHAGARVIGEAIESNLDCALHLARLVGESSDFELLAPVELSIFCFRYVGSERPQDEDEERKLDQLNERILVALQLGGSSYLSNATINGRFALRGCVLNYRTTRDDMETLLNDVRNAASQMT